MLDLAPEIENSVRDYAAREGVSIDAFTRRLLFTYTQQTTTPRRTQLEAQTAKGFAASSETEEAYEYGDQLIRQIGSETHAQDAQLAAVLDYINAPKEEVIYRNAPSAALLRAQLAEAAKATPEEIAQADAEWEEDKRRMNAHRAVTGERPLFADVLPASA